MNNPAYTRNRPTTPQNARRMPRLPVQSVEFMPMRWFTLFSASGSPDWSVFVLLRRMLLDLGRLRCHLLPHSLCLRRQLVAVLDEGHDLPDLIVRHHAVPRRHTGHADAVLGHPEQPRIVVMRDAVDQLRCRRIELVAHRADLGLCAAMAEGTVLLVLRRPFSKGSWRELDGIAAGGLVLAGVDIHGAPRERTLEATR